MNELLETVKQNLSFILICAGVTAGIYLLAWAAEKWLLKDVRRVSASRRIAYVAIFGAIGGVLMLLEIPLFFAPSFYKLDLGELPVLICTFLLGPVAGVSAELLKVLLKILLKGTSTAFVGDFANFVVGCSFILPASFVYHQKRTKKTALIGLIVGTACLTVFGSLFNLWFLIPRFAILYGLPLDVIIAMGTKVNSAIVNLNTLVLFATAPFNLLKGVVVSLLTFLLYKRIGNTMEKIISRSGPKETAKTEKSAPDKQKSR